jgi:dGTPase
MPDLLRDLELDLAGYAAKSGDSRGRRQQETDESFRTPFQRDKDRILYSTAFRRLQFKTQVYVVHEGDFYRTRLTHSLEVAQQAKTLARLVLANEDLAEAIALAHDLGHAPFGHAGEEELNGFMQGFGGFDHNLQSLRVVDHLENRYANCEGLNLTYETREGLARHKTHFDNPMFPEEFRQTPQPGLECQLVNLADETAFATHDLDDAVEQGLLTLERLRSAQIPSVEQVFLKVEQEIGSLRTADETLFRKRLVRHLISSLIWDASHWTQGRLCELKLDHPDAVRAQNEPVAGFGPQWREDFPKLMKMLIEEVYHHPNVVVMVEKGRIIIRQIFRAYLENKRLLPRAVQERLDGKGESHDYQTICDYIAEMTDVYAAQVYNSLFTPLARVPERYGR